MDDLSNKNLYSLLLPHTMKRHTHVDATHLPVVPAAPKTEQNRTGLKFSSVHWNVSMNIPIISNFLLLFLLLKGPFFTNLNKR